jgi:two-component system phosphate regulon sensor histidine kinase PhoR
MFRSIRWRIAIPYSLLILVGVLAMALYLSNYIRRSRLAELERQMTSEARLLGTLLEADLADRPVDLFFDEQARRWADLLNARVTLIAPDGLVLGESHEDRAQMDNHRLRPEVELALAGGSGSSIRYSQTVQFDMLYVAVAVRSGGENLGVVRLALPLAQVQAEIDSLRRSLLTAAVVAMGLALGLAMLIAHLISEPLRELTLAAQRMSQNVYHESLITHSADEIGQLGLAFNLMAAQIRSQFTDLAAERSRLAAVLQAMTDGVLIVNPQGQVQLMNPAAGRLFEIQPTDVQGYTVAEALRYHQIVELWRSCHNLGESQDTYIELPQRRLLLHVAAIPLEEPALPGSTLLLIQDLTHLRRLETVRRDFISNISHELRTPLASLKALTETLQESALDDPPAARRFLTQMEAEVDALTLMVQELLELARIESGKAPLQLAAVSPCDLIASAVERLSLPAERAKLEVSVDCAPDLPVVLADQARMEQVIVNLLHNAIKFTPSGGKIRLSAQAWPGAVQFSVQDTGVGISAADLPRIFERFYKADRARSGGGTGLGLAISRHLVEAHGGRIWAESQVGQGSTFYFTLPQEPQV